MTIFVTHGRSHSSVTMSVGKPETPLPVGEKVVILGDSEFMPTFVKSASCDKPCYRRVGHSNTLAYIGQGHHRSIKFQLVGVRARMRFPSRLNITSRFGPIVRLERWTDYVSDAKNLVIVLRVYDDNDYYKDYFSVLKDETQSILRSYTDKNIVILFEYRTNEQLEATGPLHSSFVQWIDELQENYTVSHFPVCLETGRGMEAALDWLIDHLPAPAPEPEVKKSRSALHWLAEVGKKVLTVGATPKTPISAHN